MRFISSQLLAARTLYLGFTIQDSDKPAAIRAYYFIHGNTPFSIFISCLRFPGICLTGPSRTQVPIQEQRQPGSRINGRPILFRPELGQLHLYKSFHHVLQLAPQSLIMSHFIGHASVLLHPNTVLPGSNCYCQTPSQPCCLFNKQKTCHWNPGAANPAITGSMIFFQRFRG